MAKTKPAKSVLDSGRVKNLVRVVKIVGPVVAPYALQAAGAARQSYDRRRARRLGVPVTDLAAYSGKGGALLARIAGVTTVLGQRQQRGGGVDAPYAEHAAARLDELAAVVRAAERMPAARRRTAHRAVAKEVDVIEAELLHRLGV